MTQSRIVVTGAAGLVGQNLILQLKAEGYRDIVAIDKHVANTAFLRRFHPDLRVIIADLSRDDSWQDELTPSTCLVVAHAQLGGIEPTEFAANSITSTERLLDAAKANKVPYVIHVSSSVLTSAALNIYTESKRSQEAIALASGIPSAVLRPSLMFGWFDRKNVGWLARFMARSPIFPIPGDGRYVRQPLYVSDFCAIIIALLKSRATGIYPIAGLQKIDYIDLVRAIRDALQLKKPIVKIPYRLFHMMVATYSAFDKNPPFATYQLESLVEADLYETVNWPTCFGVTPTPLATALRECFQHPVYSNVVLEF